jgi:glutamate:GABA antiporter
MSVPATEPAAAPPPELRRVLGVWDIILLNVVAVVGLRWITRGARIGAPALTLWIMAWLAFFLPLALAVSELSSRYPEQGGIYAWVRRAFGPFHAFLCGWCLWVNNLFYFPSLLLFAAANVAVLFESRFPRLSDDRLFSSLFVLGWLWFIVALNIRGFAAGRWLQNIGGIGTWVPAGLLIAAGGLGFFLFGSATSFAPEDLLPREDVLSSVSLWASLCFAFSGFEIGSFAGQEVKHPERTIPRGVLISGAIVTVIYILGTAAVLVAVPATELAERSGIADAVEAVSKRVGLPVLGGLTAGLVAAAAIAGTSSWSAGAARVSFAAGLDRIWPAFMARLHPVYRTPHVTLIVQGIVSSLLFLVSLFFTIGGGTTSVQEAYDVLVNVTILVYFVPYLYLFLAFVRLRHARPSGEAARAVLLVPGGRAGLWLLALTGPAATAISIALVFLPPAGTPSVLNYEVRFILQVGAVLLFGVALYLLRRKST